MSRSDLERLSKEELIELVLKLHWPEKTSRTSSKPPATDRKERREKARPGGAKTRAIASAFVRVWAARRGGS
jgi:transposase